MANQKRNRRQKIVIKEGNVSVRIYHRRKQHRSGKVYEEFIVVDHSEKKRRLHSRSTEAEARALAKAIAEDIAHGQVQAGVHAMCLGPEIDQAVQMADNMGLQFRQVFQLVGDAVEILEGRHHELLEACRLWMKNRPGAFNPVTVADATKEYLDHAKASVSRGRHESLTRAYAVVARKFGDRPLHEITVLEWEDWMASKGWAPKTYNDYRSEISLLYTRAQKLSHVPPGCNPAREVTRRKVIQSEVAIFDPASGEQVLHRLAVNKPELVPWLALWMCSGARKEEVARLTWEEVNAGLATGYIELVASKAKPGRTRNLILTDNLRAWLMTHHRQKGPILPPAYQEYKALSHLGRTVSKATGIPWKPNGPRHSFGTYYFKVTKDIGEVVKRMGTSLEKFQRHYWSKCETVTEEVAGAWFDIYPAGHEKVAPLPQKKTASAHSSKVG